mgnify:CR=1 FL=1
MYKERKLIEGKYKYFVECPSCSKGRWVSNAKATRCKSCAGKQTYTKPKKDREDKCKRGDGYVTKQGYHLMYVDGKYVPAHRLLFPSIPKEHVVHHIDGDKLNNVRSNLYPCDKRKHRLIHSQLESLSYLLIQKGLIVFEEDAYYLSTTMEKFMVANSVNSGEAIASSVDGNPEPSPIIGKVQRLSVKEYTQVGGSAEDLTVV